MEKVEKVVKLESNFSHCNFVVTRKNRFCRMEPVNGSHFCWQHIPREKMNGETLRLRVNCPLDSKHNCFQDELERHLKRCNNRKKEEPVYFEENVNSGDQIFQHCIEVLLKDVPKDKLLAALKKVENMYIEIPPIAEKISSSVVVEKELSNPTYGFGVLKHLKQNASLLGTLEHNDLLRDGNLFIEFGAGRGQLSHWIVQTQADCGKCAFLLVDKASQRHKLDNRIKAGVEIQRIKIDIKNLNLGRVSLVQKFENLVIIGKHLCGAATDLTLRCISSNSIENSWSSNDERTRKVKGILIASCCHHRCTWQSYVGKEYLERNGIGEEEFYILRKISSWATCGQKTHLGTANVESSVDGETTERHNYKELDLTHKQRELLGFKSKLILDYGRSIFLQTQGFRSELIYYTHKEISPENVAILATPR